MNILDQILPDCKSAGFDIQPIKNDVISRSTQGAVIKIDTISNSYILKVSEKPSSDILRQEVIGLDALRQTGTFVIPEVICQGKTDQHQFLVMKFIESGSPNWISFGEQLAKLHQHTTDSFGWQSDNFIASLEQRNRQHTNWTVFYIQERIAPQLKLAKQKGHLQNISFKALDRMENWMHANCPESKPALLHGDLWNGNALFDKHGNPALIDPSVYYGSREMDLAMMQLFGGFPQDVFDAYQATYPLDPEQKERVALYQLYPLLVHLNLFGKSYESAVIRSITNYV
jgi:protein-ribulosamine 3-kinase